MTRLKKSYWINDLFAAEISLEAREHQTSESEIVNGLILKARNAFPEHHISVGNRLIIAIGFIVCIALGAAFMHSVSGGFSRG